MKEPGWSVAYRARPENKAKDAERRRRYMQDPVYRAKRAEQQRTRNARPDVKEKKRAYRKTVAAKTMATQLRRYYGLSVESYNALAAGQSGVCAICGNQCKSGRLVVDHDHATGVVRALLCKLCNMGIGSLGDSPERCAAAFRYLAEHARG